MRDGHAVAYAGGVLGFADKGGIGNHGGVVNAAIGCREGNERLDDGLGVLAEWLIEADGRGTEKREHCG